MNKMLSIGINGLKDTHIEGLKKVAGENIKIEEIDLEKDIDGKFDIIVHKPVKWIAKSMMSGKEQKQLTRIEKFEAKNPSVLLDPLKSIKILCDRNELCELLKEFNISTDEGTIRSPKHVSARNKEELDELIMNGFPLKFPVICKPFVGDGNDFSHQCAFAHNEKGLYEMPLPAIFQQYHDHDAVIYKIYVLGDEISQIQRPSLENYREDIVHPDFEYFGRISNARENGSKEIVATKLPSDELLKDAIEHLRSFLPMTFFGFDLIYNSETQSYYIIDINYLPGYYDVKNLHSRILSYILKAYYDRN